MQITTKTRSRRRQNNQHSKTPNTSARVRPAFPAIFRLITRERISFYIRLFRIHFSHSPSSKGHVPRASLSVRSSDYDLWRDVRHALVSVKTMVFAMVRLGNRVITVRSGCRLPGRWWGLCDDGGFRFRSVVGVESRCWCFLRGFAVFGFFLCDDGLSGQFWVFGLCF